MGEGGGIAGWEAAVSHNIFNIFPAWNPMHRSIKNSLLTFFAALGITLAGIVHAQQEVAPIAIVGNWTTTVQHPSGATITTVVQFAQSMQFKSSSTVNGAAFIEASGTWKLSDKILEWRYEQSSHPAIQKGFVDSDVIESVSSNEMSLVSKLSGKKQRYQRVK